jgi:hypothetical protein
MKRLISILVSLGILALIYSKIHVPELLGVFSRCHPGWMTVSIAMVVPLTLFTALRLQLLMPDRAPMRLSEATRLILTASVLNMVLPAKMGDIAKAMFMKEHGNLGGTLALSLVVFEKACDMLSLLLWCAVGLLLHPTKGITFWLLTAGITGGLVLGVTLLASLRISRAFFAAAARVAPGKFKAKLEKLRASWEEMHGYFWASPRKFLRVTAMSVFIWFLHVLQIWLFILALRAWVPFLISIALSPLAILAGLLPLTFAGVGTRDAALIVLYQPYFDAETGAALGLLCTARYLLPAIGGLPFLQQYLATLQGRKNASISESQSATLNS